MSGVLREGRVIDVDKWLGLLVEYQTRTNGGDLMEKQLQASNVGIGCRVRVDDIKKSWRKDPRCLCLRELNTPRQVNSERTHTDPLYLLGGGRRNGTPPIVADR